jgi:hypothetical protein
LCCASGVVGWNKDATVHAFRGRLLRHLTARRLAHAPSLPLEEQQERGDRQEAMSRHRRRREERAAAAAAAVDGIGPSIVTTRTRQAQGRQLPVPLAASRPPSLPSNVLGRSVWSRASLRACPVAAKGQGCAHSRCCPRVATEPEPGSSVAWQLCCQRRTLTSSPAQHRRQHPCVPPLLLRLP